MNAVDYEAEYNNRARVPEHPAIIAGWERDAAAYRAEAGARHTALRYGEGERHTIDLFAPEGEAKALVAFIHGGYWQALHPASFSHMARGLNAHGIAVAIPGYSLCPHVRVGDIVEEMRRACRLLAARGPLTVAGHSAGGHLAACMLAADGDLPAPARAAYAISGLFDLEPLLATSVNKALGMDRAEARLWSPLLWTPPQGARLEAVVGGAESQEYLRQSRAIAERWGAEGVETHCEILSGANHFTVIAPLAEPDSAMTRRVRDLALGAS